MSNIKNVKVNLPKGTYSVNLILFIVFLILKLTDTIDWSWWWVTSPLWIPLAFTIVVMLFMSLSLIITVGLVALQEYLR